jgi:hypothetical protein
MTPAQQERWQKIERFAFDRDGAVATFESRVMRDAGWTRHAARRAIAEYRRFLLLAAEAGHPVSPSPAVDHVWHAHLLYTRNYWDDLCPDVLGRKLHHEPADGTGDDAAKLHDWYARTLASYASIFGEPPPPDLWPERPRHEAPRHVDPAQSVVLPRAAWRVVLATLFLTATALAAIILWLAVRSAQ